MRQWRLVIDWCRFQRPWRAHWLPLACECIAGRQPSVSKEAGQDQSLNLPLPCFWTSQTSELGEAFPLFVEYPVLGVLIQPSGGSETKDISQGELSPTSRGLIWWFVQTEYTGKGQPHYGRQVLYSL